LNWTPSPDVPADSYNIYRGPKGAETTLLNATPVAAPPFIDENPPAGPVSYVVRSVQSGVESVNSNEITVTVPLQPPTDLVASVA
jgi:hypothetical protein